LELKFKASIQASLLNIRKVPMNIWSQQRLYLVLLCPQNLQNVKSLDSSIRRLGIS
jgi:hypothetical protein